MNPDEIKNKIARVFEAHPEVELAYLFGSQATGRAFSTNIAIFCIC